MGDVLARNGYEPSPFDPNKFRSPSAQSPPDNYGVLISEDNTCFSFHGNDPLCGMLMNDKGEEERRCYNAFNAFRILEHNEDYGAAYTAAEKELGLNTFSYEPKQPSNIPKLIDYDLMATQFPPLKYIIPKYLPEGLFILAGKQKLGKSWLALDMSLAVATGGTVLNEQVEQGRAIYFALEDGARRLQDRLLKLGLKDKQPELLALAEMGSLPPLDEGGYELLENLLKLYTDTRLLIIDTLGMIKPPTSNKNAYEEDVKIMAPLREMAKQYGISLVLVTHVRKTEANDTFDEVHGSVGLTGTADGTIKLNRKRGCNNAVMDITGRDIEEVSMAIEFNKNTFKWEVLGEAATVELTDKQKKIVDALTLDANLPPSKIADAIGEERHSVSNILSRMYRDEIVIK
ncbi:MAG: AAA family ATPase [Calditrichaeota bacterium]|nr:AAA family ATPase [Calditrichota bacterium]